MTVCTIVSGPSYGGGFFFVTLKNPTTTTLGIAGNFYTIVTPGGGYVHPGASGVVCGERSIEVSTSSGGTSPVPNAPIYFEWSETP
jgi:hypothetical protein